MKKLSLRTLLIVVAVFVALITSLITIAFCEVDNKIMWRIFLLVFCLSLVSSIFFLFFIHFIVFKKINNLLDKVKDFRSSEKSGAIYNEGNELDKLDSEIQAWANDRKEEIERLKKLEVYRKEFLGNVSHELKTPIFNIQGYVLTLLDGGLEDETINRSQLETGELQIEPEKFDIVALTKDVCEAQEMKATAKGIMLSMPGDGKPVYVYADRFRIRQVLVNLIVNSVKYGKEYGETKIRFYDAGEKVSIEVADNGLGISKEHLPRLFERFYRVDKSRSREMGGTGLGLAIVKHILEGHNQTINVMSTEGVGTVFSFTLKKG
ncbi:MAG: histidine kinase [Bacteroidetes bacterium]|nr:histidine kinase [Bacteroidota bacterium]